MEKIELRQPYTEITETLGLEEDALGIPPEVYRKLGIDLAVLQKIACEKRHIKDISVEPPIFSPRLPEDEIYIDY